jgi:hypothetical protein
MALPAKLLKTTSQATTALIALALIIICRLFDPTFLSSHMFIPFLIAMFFAALFQEPEFSANRNYVAITILNAVLIFVSAFGMSFGAPPVEKVIRSGVAMVLMPDRSKVHQVSIDRPEPEPFFDARETFFKNWNYSEETNKELKR